MRIDDAHRHEYADQADSSTLLLDCVPDCPPHLFTQTHPFHLLSVHAEFSLRDGGGVVIRPVTLYTSMFHIETRCDGGMLAQDRYSGQRLPGALA